MNAALARYRRVLTARHVLPLITSSVVARLPIGVLALALVLFLREHTGSYSVAGGIAGVFAVANALAAPVVGRLVDRVGHARVIIPAAIVHASSLVGVVALGLADVPPGAIVAPAVLAGLSVPPISAPLRALWPSVTGDETLLSAAYALDSVLIEVVFIVGPALTAFVVATFSTAAAVLASGVFALSGSLWFVSLEPSRTWRASGEPTGVLGALASPGVRTLTIAMFPFGFCIGAFEVAMPAFGAEHGSESLPGLLLALQGVGSMAGGLWYGATEHRFGGSARAYLILLAVVPLAFGVLALPDSVGVMAVLVALTGAALAPLAIAENQVLQRVAPPAAITEALTWLIMAVVLGIAAGNAAGGAIVDASGWPLALVVAAAVSAGAAILTFGRRRTLYGVYGSPLNTGQHDPGHVSQAPESPPRRDHEPPARERDAHADAERARRG